MAGGYTEKRFSGARSPEREPGDGWADRSGNFCVIMDIDRINAICAEIDDGMKSFGKNREWDFTAAVRTADTDTDTGTAPADKWAMVNRLLADLDKIREK